MGGSTEVRPGVQEEITTSRRIAEKILLDLNERNRCLDSIFGDFESFSNTSGY